MTVAAGTGYNAALLAEIVGAENVVSVEIDPGLAEQARGSLRRSGHAVAVVTADGESGYPAGAPYDRVVATAAATEVPYAWVAQTRPGGRLLVPWGPGVHPDNPLALLTVQDDGTAVGRFIAPAWFMPLRGQRCSARVTAEAEERWARAGRPDRSRYGISVSAGGQRVWLDSPDTPISP
ncbi:protein-L-isoaspartate O-methyltransferase family protein [Spirillospora sp. NBC_01491]|uniref:protein-L-isoaspartate O-methyltransferase family protein n=1 Tax=Spirillospora sp. NBC_01491 TaxID=2976007 RepID=UPI002E34DF97|nr:methyltransferase domain-containing protein [Spirillospora sp. NBC_01491]